MKNILIIEDVEDNRELLKQFFEGEFSVFEAEDGRRGLEMAGQVRPDLILMDLSLPEIDGWHAAAALKADKHLRHIPIIAITAHAMIGDEQKALQAGCDAYITKPIDFVELEKVIDRFLERE